METALLQSCQESDDAERAPVPRGDSGTRTFYEDNALSYAAATKSADLSSLLRRFAALLRSGARVLDLGSGSGRDLSGLIGLGLVPIGLDLSCNMAGMAHRHARAPVVVADMVELPFADAVFDGVWASASLLHLDKAGQATALAEVRRVLKPFGLLYSSMKRGTGEVRNDCGRTFSFVEPDDWIGRLRVAGLEVIEIASQEEVRGASTVSWLTCLGRKL